MQKILKKTYYDLGVLYTAHEYCPKLEVNRNPHDDKPQKIRDSKACWEGLGR